MKSTYEDLHRLFRDSITAREIAEPLAAFDANQPSEKVKGFMEAKGFDVVGVSSDGTMLGYVQIEDLQAGLLKEYTKPFLDRTLLDEKTPLLDTLRKLEKDDFVFLRFLGSPSAIVTRSDLQKAPVRMWLFGIISILEMQLLQLIKNEAKEDWWKDLLSLERQKDAQKIYKLRLEKKEEIGLVDCLQLGDKMTIFKKTDALFERTRFSSKKGWKSTMDKIESLRNNLAHSNEIREDSWPEKINLAIRIEDLVLLLEE
ncbi:hypothetical protein N9Z14_03530 [Opitutales bacterium]|nr:hypothetical protein [Opitutales bacterium]